MSIPCLIVENRVNPSIELCFQSLKDANENFFVLNNVEAGNEFSSFVDSYVHMSTNTKEFEVICFRRYFLIKNFLNEHSEIEEFVLLDSDLLVYQGLTSHIKQVVQSRKFMGSCERNYSRDKQISPHVSYWKREALYEFVEFLLNSYKDKKILYQLGLIYQEFIDNKRFGGVSDMTLLYVWATSVGKCEPINALFDGGVIDHNIGISFNVMNEQFNSIFGVKRVYFKDNKVVLKIKGRAEFFKCYALHFQGKSKNLMKSVYDKNLFSYFLLSFVLRVARNFKKFIKNVSFA